MKYILSICLITFILHACNESSKTTTDNIMKDSTKVAGGTQIPSTLLTSYRWKLSELSGKKIDSINGQEAFILFNAEDSSVAGRAGCNRFGGKYTTNDKTITFSPFFSTKMACADMWAETTLLGLVESINSFTVTESELRLMHNGETVAFFESREKD
ncbi:MAG: META domain-containing protein [Chitinophagaceae bacterium]|nr:MAG: META domain-containing protein [Chitinophagaceae bacterium]